MVLDIRAAAVEVVQTLRQAGFLAYFAGGWVRDFLLGHPSGDIDIATEAPPEKVQELFEKTFPVGKAFGVVIVVHHDHPFEVASFRKDGLYLYGRRPESVEFATPEEDAQRRDFTINGIFYDPLLDRVIDYVGGQEDLRRGVVRAIGEPGERIKEDRLRMIRGIRVMARFQFTLDPETRRAIENNAHTLFPAVAIERVWQEFTKMAERPGMGHALVELQAVGLLPVIFPALSGLSVADVAHRVEPLARFPEDCPAILCLIQLFPQASDAEIRELAEYLKVPVQDSKLACYYVRAYRHYASPSEDRVAWVRILAHPQAELCAAVHAATLSDAERGVFHDRLEKHRLSLAVPIARVRESNPLVRAAHLQAEGVRPGKQMGQLLMAAERLAIERALDNPQAVVELLKVSPDWPSTGNHS